MDTRRSNKHAQPPFQTGESKRETKYSRKKLKMKLLAFYYYYWRDHEFAGAPKIVYKRVEPFSYPRNYALIFQVISSREFSRYH